MFNGSSPGTGVGGRGGGKVTMDDLCREAPSSGTYSPGGGGGATPTEGGGVLMCDRGCPQGLAGDGGGGDS